MKNNLAYTITHICVLITVILTLVLSGCGSTPTQKENKTITKDESVQTTRKRVHDTLKPLAQTQYQMATESINKGEYKQAQKILKKLKKDAPNHPGVLVNLATLAYKQGEFEQAQKLVDNALSLDPKLAYAHNIYGLLATKKGAISQAEKSYQLAIKYDDKYANAYYNLALIFDTYYQDIATAVKYYKAYLVLSGFTDKDTKRWVEQLERTLKNGG